jgi:crossover junction endodeoxyribonuclease RuvC
VTPHLILGIDPGLSGALAFYDPKANAVTEIHDMPTLEIKGKKRLELYQMSTLVEKLAREIKMAFIEDVGAMPGQGVTSMFRFGFAAGAIQGVIASFMVPMTLVRPGVWKGAMGLSHDKDASRARASQLFPRESHRWARKMDDGRAEALLLAVFGSRLLK